MCFTVLGYKKKNIGCMLIVLLQSPLRAVRVCSFKWSSSSWSFIPQVQEALRTVIVWGLTCTLGSQRSRCRNLPRLLGWSVIRQISPSSLSPCSAVKQTSARNASLLTAVARIPPRYRCAADLKISNSTRITPPNFTVSPCPPERVCTCGLLSLRVYFF